MSADAVCTCEMENNAGDKKSVLHGSPHLRIVTYTRRWEQQHSGDTQFPLIILQFDRKLPKRSIIATERGPYASSEQQALAVEAGRGRPR